MPATEYMDVEMFDSLAAVGAGVDDEAVAAFEVLGAGDFPGCGEKLAEQHGIFGQSVGVGGDVALRDDEHVHGRLGVDVGEGERVGIVVQARDGNFTGDDLAEQAVRVEGFGHEVMIVDGGSRTRTRPKRDEPELERDAGSLDLLSLRANSRRRGSSKGGMSEANSSPSVLERLKEGARRFQSEVYPDKVAEYEYAATHPQRPHTLVIACADSRVDVETITSSGPGEVFITRNVGNMVPAYGEMPGGVSAVIEYAVSALKVQHVVVCGHSDCGAMKALLNPPSTEGLPTVRSWLRHGQAALQVAETLGGPQEQPLGKLSRLTEENVLMQILHLKTHPSVAGAIARGELTVSGWVYDIGSGGIRIAEDGTRTFVPVVKGKAGAEESVGA